MTTRNNPGRPNMRENDIVKDGTYTNGAGGVRRVVNRGKSRRPNADPNLVEYEVVAGREQGQRFSMTLDDFAKWATKRVESDGVPGSDE